MTGQSRVEVTGGFLLLVAWLNYLDRSFVVPLALAACGVHELGHIFVIRRMGGAIKGIRLTAVGAELILSRPLGYWQEGLSALAGPGANLLLALICCSGKGGLTFAGLNLALALFNLLPVGRLDGGRALRCTLALLAGPEPAERLAGWLDGLCTVAALGAGLFLAVFRGNYTLLLVAVWLLAQLFRNISPFPRNKACQRGRKKVQ